MDDGVGSMRALGVRRVRFDIRAKLLVLALVLAWLPLFGVGWLGLLSLESARDSAVATSTEALRTQAEETLAKRTADKAEYYDTVLNHVYQQVESVAAYAQNLVITGPPPPSSEGRVWIVPGGPSVENELAYPDSVARARQFIPLLKSTVRQNPLISLGYIALDEGGVVAFDQDVIDRLPPTFDPRERSWYKAASATRDTVWVDTYIDANTGKLVTTCAAPIFSADGQVIGVVGFDLLLETIQEDILKLDMGDQGYAFLLNSAGDVLVGPNLSANTLVWNQPFVGENLLRSNEPRMQSIARRMTKSERDVTRLMTKQGDIYLAYAPIRTADWSLGIVIPEAEITGAGERVGSGIATQQDQLRSQVIFIWLMSLVALPVLGIMLTLLVTRPLRTLQLGAQRIAAGDLLHRIDVKSDDEIGDLVQSFNRMTASLRQKVDELENDLHRLATLNEVSNRFKTILSLQELLDQVPVAVCEGLGFDRAVLYLVEGDRLQAVTASFGPEGQQLVQPFLEAANVEIITLDSSTVEADIVRSGQAVIVDNPWQHPRVMQLKQQISQSEAYVQVPIFGHEEKVIGLLSADYHYHARPITPRDAAQLLTYASVVGLSIENIRLYNNLEQQVAQRTTELRAALERAQEADRLKGKFLAAISHELRTPLNAIIGFSTVMLDELDGPITAIQREDLKTINQNGKFLLHLINELLDLARIEANKVELMLAPLDVSELVNEVADTVQGLIHHKPLSIRTVLPETPLYAYADHGKVRQILLNLLSNAVKFTREGHIAVVVRLVTMATNDTEQDLKSTHAVELASQEVPSTRTWVAISVRDTGIGIASDKLPLIFEEFRQVHQERGTLRGSGLGLAITRKLVEIHNGRIWVESVPGRGSTFTFTLPTCSPEALSSQGHVVDAVEAV
jgi:two-component system sensor histidine kinase/response regulator